ncbi:MAG TPA: protein kinase [Phycisphaerae bacterium]|nr:protein kinase [Phycisphaerae bacterium]
MSADRSRQVEEIFHKLLQREPGERAAYLNKACSGDPELAAEVQPLLDAYENSTDFLEKPLPATLDKAFIEEQKSGLIRAEEEALVGHRIGPWKLVRKIAAGGMGTVYLASRDDGQYQRQAAIKLIRPGLRFDEPLQRRKIIRQFRDEQQLLADLDHPNIAKLLEGGTTEDGLPYLVMEYIEGQPITEYCEQRNLSIEQRLAIFRPVCLGLQYAHGKLIAHRDLKPSNILVSSSPDSIGDPVPRLLDFGIAKLLNKDAYGESGAGTSLGLRPMTLDYASPEQVRGEAITTVSDVYSLGVVLYEVLTGRLPYEVNKYSAEWIISKELPKRPSAIRKGISRDVDAIVLKALEKDPARRYQSVAALAEDIDRHVTGRPIMARPPSALYYLGKFIVRNRWAVFLLVCGITAGLAVGISVKTKAEWDAEREQRELATWLYYVGRSFFLQKDYLTAEGILRRVIKIEEKLPAEQDWRGPWLLAERRDLLAQCLLAQGKHNDEAVDLVEKSYPPLREYFGESDRRIRDARDRIIDLYTALGKPESAYRLLGEPVKLPPLEEPSPANGAADREPTSKPG